MAIFQKTYADLIRDLETAIAKTPHVKPGTGGVLQKEINALGMGIISYELRAKFPEARALLKKRNEHQANIQRVEILEKTFQSRKAGSEESLVSAIAFDGLNESEIRQCSTVLEDDGRCLKVIDKALKLLRAEQANIDAAFSKVPTETQEAVQALDPLNGYYRTYFQDFFESQSAFTK